MKSLKLKEIIDEISVPDSKKYLISEGVFLIIRDDEVPVINVNNKIESGTISSIIQEYGVKIVTISGETNDELFDEIVSIKQLSILKGISFNNEKLYKLKNLTRLYIEYPNKTPINFSQLSNLIELEIGWNKSYIGLEKLDKLVYLKLKKIDRKDLDIALPPNVEIVELVEGKLESLKGLEKLNNLKGLVIAYQNKLTDFSSISSMNEMWFLHFMNCKELKDLNFLKPVKKLRQVLFENSKSIESLSPLESIESLKLVRVIGTSKILDGDTSLTKTLNERGFYSYPYQWE